MEPIHSNAGSLSAEMLEQLRPAADSELPMVRQLYLALYKSITEGHLPYGHRLPASRELAERLSIARNTVVAVYQQLTDEALVESKGRQGTRISYRTSQLKTNPVGRWSPSQRSQRLVKSSFGSRPFTPGQPDTTLFPAAAWRQALQKASRMSPELLSYRPEPLKALQQAIARYLAVYRSLHVEPEQILITASTRQSLLLAALLFADEGDTAWVETPGYNGAVDAFRQQGLELIPCDVDVDGMRLPDAAPPPRLVYLTPCFQYPLGHTLSPERRKTLLELSTRHGTVLFEDDYDTEFRDDSIPRPALASNDLGACVLNAGTFSKLMFPAVRVAWLVLPSSFVDAGYRGLKAIGGCDNTVNQFAVAELLNNGTIAQHLKRARQIYSQRVSALVVELSKSKELKTGSPTGSLCIVVELKKPIPLKPLVLELNAAELGAVPLERLQWQRKTTPRMCTRLVLGLGNVASLDIPVSVRVLDKAIAKARTKH